MSTEYKVTIGDASTDVLAVSVELAGRVATPPVEVRLVLRSDGLDAFAGSLADGKPIPAMTIAASAAFTLELINTVVTNVANDWHNGGMPSLDLELAPESIAITYQNGTQIKA